MTRSRTALASLAVLAALSTAALGSPALADDELTPVPPPASEIETHGYSSVKEITDEVREDFPAAGLLTESVPENELIRGGPSFDAEGTALILSE